MISFLSLFPFILSFLHLYKKSNNVYRKSYFFHPSIISSTFQRVKLMVRSEKREYGNKRNIMAPKNKNIVNDSDNDFKKKSFNGSYPWTLPSFFPFPDSSNSSPNHRPFALNLVSPQKRTVPTRDRLGTLTRWPSLKLPPPPPLLSMILL